MRIAVLLTVFNRREKTLACLTALRRQSLPKGLILDVYLTDDNSADGTAETVQFYYPDINVFKGSGALFWAGGMRNSWSAALEGQYEYYLLLNDDTILYEDAISKLVDTSKRYETQGAICLGATCDERGKVTYGGRSLVSRLGAKSKMVFSETTDCECDLGNANIMLVPNKVVEKLGILSSVFTHGIADYDYTLRAKRNGFKVLVCAGFLGFCTNDHGKNWVSGNVDLRSRIKFLMSPKGLAYNEYMYFMRSHFPLSVPSVFVKLWAKTFFPFIWDRFKKVH